MLVSSGAEHVSFLVRLADTWPFARLGARPGLAGSGAWTLSVDDSSAICPPSRPGSAARRAAHVQWHAVAVGDAAAARGGVYSRLRAGLRSKLPNPFAVDTVYWIWAIKQRDWVPGRCFRLAQTAPR